jgi:hypothetical protein
MPLRETPETIASSLRRHGHVVPCEPQPPTLLELLEETKRRIDSGERFEQLSRRDPEALAAIATSRPLTPIEAAMILARLQYQDALLAVSDASRERERSWARIQGENAGIWGRQCAELGRAMERIAEVVGSPGAEEDPDRVVELVNETIECLRAERMPQNDDVRALMYAAMALPPERAAALRARAEAQLAESGLGRALVDEVIKAVKE